MNSQVEAWLRSEGVDPEIVTTTISRRFFRVTGAPFFSPPSSSPALSSKEVLMHGAKGFIMAGKSTPRVPGLGTHQLATAASL